MGLIGCLFGWDGFIGIIIVYWSVILNVLV